MASFRNALLLVAFVVIVGGVSSATFQQRDYKRRPSVWSAKMSPLNMLSLWKNHDNGNKAGVNGVSGCCWPSVLATTVYQKITSEEGQKNEDVEYIEATFYREQEQKRFAYDMTEGDVTVSSITLCSGSGATLYRFFKATKQCRKRQLRYCPLDPDPLCFPDNPTVVASFSLGAGPGSLAAQLWDYSSADAVLTPGNCLPLAMAWETRSGDQKSTVEEVFANATLSIPDPTVFTPPSYCNQGEVEDDGTLPFDRPGFDIAALFGRFAPFP